MNRIRQTGLTAAAVLAACGAASADVQRSVVAVTGTGAGSAGGLFQAFGNARINEEGEVLFWARRTANDPLINDVCEGAVPIGLGGTVFTTEGATDSITGCASRSDVWFTFTDTSDAPSTMVQFYMSAEYSQRALAVLSGNCDTLAPIACFTTSPVTINFTPGMRTVMLRVGSNAADARGAGTLVARLVGSPASPVVTADGGLWKAADGGLQTMLLEGSVVTDEEPLVHESMSMAAFTDFGMLITGGVQGVPAYSYTRAALMTQEDGQVGVGVLAIDPVPTPPPLPMPVIPGPSGLTAAGEAAYALLDGSSVTYGQTTHVTGTAAPGLDGLSWVHFDQPGVSSNGMVAWRSRLSGTGVVEANESVLWKDAGAGPVLVARTGAQAPSAPAGAVFAQLGADVGIDHDGGVAFWGELTGTGIDESNRAGIWSDRGGSLAAVARAGEPAGGQDGAVFSMFSRRPMTNGAGAIAFAGFVTGGSSTATTNSGLWVSEADGTRRVVVREGDAAPGAADGVVFATFAEPVLNEAGDVAFLATLRGGDVTPQTAQMLCVARADGTIEKIARTGEVMSVGGEDRTVREVLFGTGRPQAGHGQFNSSSSLIYGVAFTDRSSALVRADVTDGPVCAADFDGDGTIAVPDIFAFLSAWFAQDPAAEFDGTPGITVPDIFAFLSAWFAGC